MMCVEKKIVWSYRNTRSRIKTTCGHVNCTGAAATEASTATDLMVKCRKWDICDKNQGHYVSCHRNQGRLMPNVFWCGILLKCENV